MNDYDSFDRFGRKIKDYWRTDTEGVFVDQFDYSYDLAGNLTSRNNQVETSQDRTYRYDDLNQLFSSNEIDAANDRYFGRDQVGNLSEIRNGLTASSTLIDNRAHNSANELTNSSKTANPSHDAAGNMIVVPSPKVVGATIAATYDAWNRLVELGSSGYRYNGVNQRITRTEPSTGTTKFYYNKNSQVLTETDGSDTPKAIYSYWQGYIDAVAVRMRPNDEYLFTHDNQYSVTSAVNRVNRQVVERYRYSPYGETTVLTPEFTPKTDNTLENEYTYTGRRLDPSGLMYFRARYYDPQTGEFISRDPLGYVDGMSLYRGYFVPGRVDPLGLDDFEWTNVGVGYVLDEFLSYLNYTEDMWAWGPAAEYTRIMKEWSYTKDHVDSAKELVAANLEKWQNDHTTSKNWQPTMAYAPDPRAGYNALVRSPDGTDPVTAGKEYKQYLWDKHIWSDLTRGSEALHKAAVGSYRVIITADSISIPENGPTGKVTLNVWLYNSMSEKSFGKFADEWYSTGKPFATSHMWWNFKETFEVTIDQNGQCTAGDSETTGGGGGW